MAFVNTECRTKIRNDRVVRHRISWGRSAEVAGEGELG